MGVDSKRSLPLPAPTETDTNTPTELTDASKLPDEKSSYSIPDDGTPVTIRTRGHGHRSNKSQTSLLIEYFEGGKPGPDSATGSRASRKPSVRVRLTPSGRGKGDHFQVTEGSSSRRGAALTHRIPLDDGTGSTTRQIELPDPAEDSNSLASYASATEESNVSRNPIDIEIDHGRRRRRPASPLIPSEQQSYLPGVDASEISAIPADSFLDGTGPSGTDIRRASSPSILESSLAGAGAAGTAAALTSVASDHVRSGKRKDRVKIADRPREKPERTRRSKSRASSVSDYPEEGRSSRHRASRGGIQESTVSAGAESALSSHLAQSHRSFDAHSMRSGTSKASASSINNPKLLETVEDAIRRLILPELSALKRETSQRETRRGSLTSTGTSVSRDDATTPDGGRRRSSGQRSASSTRGSGRRRNREARHDYGDSSPHSISRESIHDDYHYDDGEPTTPKRSDDLLKVAATSSAMSAMSKGFSSMDDDSQLSEDRGKRDRRRRRADGARSRSLGRDRYAEEYPDEDPAPAPPMPLNSDLGASELTRTSMLSADTDRPHSASEEMGPESSSRGGLEPSAAESLQQTLGTSHANVSHGDLTALPRGQKPEYAGEYETDEFGRKIPMSEYDDEYLDEHDPAYSESNYHDQDEPSFEDEYYNHQDVPPPLKYVPYQAGARGLSPIPSVSGYTEGGSEVQPRHERSIDSINDAYEKSLERGAADLYADPYGAHSAHSSAVDSIPSNMRSREFDDHDDHDHLSAAEGQSSHGGSATGYRDAMYTDESELMPPNQSSVASQDVRPVGASANPNIVHPPQPFESAVASLVDGSMLTSASGRNYTTQGESNLSYNTQQTSSSRGISPDKYSAQREFTPGDDSHYTYQPTSTVSAMSQDQDRDQDHDYSHDDHYTEYELDDQGRKVAPTQTRQYHDQQHNSPTASEAAITAGAVGAAAAALKAAQERKVAGGSIQDRELAEEHDDASDAANWVPAGVERNKSFKQRTMDGYEPRNTPAHSVDRFSYEETPKLGASGLPDMHNPMPEIGYVDDAMTDVHEDEHDWDAGRATPTQRSVTAHSQGRGLGIEDAAAGAAAAAAGAAVVSSHSREPSQDQDNWHRTSDDRKRDTLITNPYEDASPMANPTFGDNILGGGSRSLNAPYGEGYATGSPGPAQKYDEGYMSNGPNAQSPAIEPKGKALDFSAAPPTMDMDMDDPFYVPKGGLTVGNSNNNGGNDANPRQVSGMSHGMGSPFYDAAMGGGIDRIENKDIVALMQHLMVRDAQRSARDTEIVALLMNAALEMRNSFREMKELIQDTGDDVIFSGTENTEKLQKAINGPRPYPGGPGSAIAAGAASRSIHSSQPATLDDAAAKKKNLWKRALAGLSAKGTNDLSRIEDMLMQLLGEVDVLKTQTAQHPEGQTEHDRGYEPEGISTASHASHSDHLSSGNNNNTSNPPPVSHSRSQGFNTNNRVSTVEEHEDEYRYDSPRVMERGMSLPPGSPSSQLASPSQQLQQQQPLSADNTPRTERTKKHKSSSSSGIIPKISRWSETTASSLGKAFRRKDAKYDDDEEGGRIPASRSGSSIGSYDQTYDHDPYYEEGDRMQAGLTTEPTTMTGATSSMARSRGSPLQEDPKYRAHRNSLNLQHPQPRPGQTERFRTALETSAQEYNDPATPRSADWAGASSTSLPGLTQSQTQAQGEYLGSPTGGAPPRPPKEPLDANSPGAGYTGRTPPRARISRLAKGSPLSSQVSTSMYDGAGYGSPGPASPTLSAGGGSPRPENRNLNNALGIPARRPTGPRAMTPKSPEDEAAREERRRKRDTFGTVASQDTDTF